MTSLDPQTDARAYVGPENRYDLMAANQFNLMTSLGLRQSHRLLDVGCGCLRAGKLFIPYLKPGGYFGVDPNRWLIEQGIQDELGQDILQVKRPSFVYSETFDFSAFNTRFDYLLAQSILSHCGRSQVEALFRGAGPVMDESSVLVFDFYQGDTDHDGDAWTYPKNVRYTWSFMESALRDAGLMGQRFDWPHPKFQWVAVVREGSPDRLDRALRRLIEPMVWPPS